MPRWDVIAIYGVGLIGGSIGMALRQRGLARQVVGIGRGLEPLHQARVRGAIDAATTSLAEGVSEAELVIVATPVHCLAEHVMEVRRHCLDSCLVTDAGSTKQALIAEIERRAATEASRGRFLGSHPLAGSEKSGVEAAQAGLFEGRLSIITPTAQTEPSDVESLTTFWNELGASVQVMSAAEHDRVLAQTSHLPHVLASALAASTPLDWLPYTASGWSDSTRIASGDVPLWVPILLQNRDDVLKALERVDHELDAFRAALAADDPERLTELLAKGKHCRDALGS